MIEFPGAIILITHDRWLLERVCNELVGFDHAGGIARVASIEQWEQLLDKAAARLQSAPASTDSAEPAESNKEAADNLSWAERKELRGLESRIAKAEEKVETIQGELADEKVYTNPQLTAEKTAALEAAQAAVDELYARWEELEAKA